MGLAGGVVNDPTTDGTGTLGTVEVEGRRRHPGWYLKVLWPTGVGDAERLGAGRDCSRRRKGTGHHRPDRSHRDHHGHHRPIRTRVAMLRATNIIPPGSVAYRG
jgi:hypothetical protein